jgi:hypothetical protein
LITNTWPTDRGPDAAVVDVEAPVVGEDESDDEDEHAVSARASATAHATTRRGFRTGEA